MDESLNFITVLYILAFFTVIVVTIFLFEYRRIRRNLAAREQEMTRRMYQLSILRELGERIGYSLNIQQIIEIIAGSLRRVLDYATVSYLLVKSDTEGKTKLLFNINLEKPVNKIFIQGVRRVMVESVSALFGRQFSPEDIEETVSGTITDPTAPETVGSFFNVPIVIGGSPVGLLTIADPVKGRYKNEKEVEILYTIMNQASDAVTKLEHVLKVEKGKLNSMVASMADGVLMIDKVKQLAVINPAAKSMLGLGDRHVNIFDVLDALGAVLDLRTKLEESIAQDKLIIVPSVSINNYVIQVLISPVKDEQKNFIGAVVLLHDISKEKELEKLREDFTSMMVHELRSPLTGIKSIAGLLLSDSVKNDQKKYGEFVQLISTNSQDMLGLVNDLLDVAKLESGKFQVLKKNTDIKAVIEQRVGSFKPLADQNNLNLVAQVSPDTSKTLSFDEHKIAQVLNNFISNSIKFTGAGGTVTVAAFPLAKGKDLAQAVVEQHLNWPGIRSGTIFPSDQVIVAVTDTGTGIPAANISKLFNKFVQLENAAHSEKKGTGLGLVISKGIVEAHQGTIGVFSEEGEGTTFYFTLPVAVSQ